MAQRFGACLWPRARSWRPGIESHVRLPVHGACFSFRLCLCLSLSLSVTIKNKFKKIRKKINKTFLFLREVWCQVGENIFVVGFVLLLCYIFFLTLMHIFCFCPSPIFSFTFIFVITTVKKEVHFLIPVVSNSFG